MNEVHRTQDGIEAHFLRGLLEANGIEAFVQGEDSTAIRGHIPFSKKAALKICIYDAVRIDEAKTLVSTYMEEKAAEAPAGEAWLCPNCQERLEGQFTLCWRCGSEREL